MQIVIPFQMRWKSPMLEGRKSSTWRSKPMGVEGDIFDAFGARFLLTKIESVEYGKLVREHYSSEGCHSENELRAAIKLIWRGKEPEDNTPGWLHHFVRLMSAE